MSIMECIWTEARGIDNYLEAFLETKKGSNSRKVTVNIFLNKLCDNSKEKLTKMLKLKGTANIVIPLSSIEKLNNSVQSIETLFNTLSSYYLEIKYKDFVGIRIYNIESSKKYADRVGNIKFSVFSTSDKKIRKLILKDIGKLYKAV